MQPARACLCLLCCSRCCQQPLCQLQRAGHPARAHAALWHAQSLEFREAAAAFGCARSHMNGRPRTKNTSCSTACARTLGGLSELAEAGRERSGELALRRAAIRMLPSRGRSKSGGGLSARGPPSPTYTAIVCVRSANDTPMDVGSGWSLVSQSEFDYQKATHAAYREYRRYTRPHGAFAPVSDLRRVLSRPLLSRRRVLSRPVSLSHSLHLFSHTRALAGVARHVHATAGLYESCGPPAAHQCPGAMRSRAAARARSDASSSCTAMMRRSSAGAGDLKVSKLFSNIECSAYIRVS